MHAKFNEKNPWSCSEAAELLYELPLAVPRPVIGLGEAGGNTPVAVKLAKGYMIAMVNSEGKVCYYGILTDEGFTDGEYHLIGLYPDSIEYTQALYRAYSEYSYYRSGDAYLDD